MDFNSLSYPCPNHAISIIWDVIELTDSPTYTFFDKVICLGSNQAINILY
jgi:hypothetical protein